MATLRSQFQRFLFGPIEEAINRGFIREKPPQMETLYNMKTMDAAFVEDMTWAGVGLFVRTEEGVESSEDQFMPGFRKRYQALKYMLAIGMTHEEIRDGKVNIWDERAPDMGYSARQTREVLGADLVNGGFTTSIGPDGQPLFSAAHPNIRGGGTQSNILNPVGTVTVVNVRLALTTGRLFFDDTGVRRLNVEWKYLWHQPTVMFDVNEILKSAERPDTANRAINVIHLAVEPFTWDYLTDPKAWGLFAAKGDHKVKWFDRERFQVTEFEDEKAQVNWVQAWMRFDFGFSHWRGTLGSNPP